MATAVGTRHLKGRSRGGESEGGERFEGGSTGGLVCGGFGKRALLKELS